MPDKKQEKKKSHKAGRNRRRSNYSEIQKLHNKRKRIEKHLHRSNRKASRTGKSARTVYRDGDACWALRGLGTKRPELLKAAESLPLTPVVADWPRLLKHRRKFLASPSPPTGCNFWRKNYAK